MSLATWFIATRPWSLVMTVVSTCLAGLLAYSYGVFSPFLFLLVLVGLVTAHVAANMANDYFDVEHGVDTQSPASQHRPHPLLGGELDKQTYKTVVAALYSTGMLIGLAIAWIRGPIVLILAAAGAFLGYFYTADPVKLKHKALGEASVFLAFGPLMVGGAFYAITGALEWKPFLAAVPTGLFVSLVLLANNIRDKEFDAHHGIKTIATNKDTPTGISIYSLVLVAAYASTLALIAVGFLSPFTFITLLSAVEARRLLKGFHEEFPPNADQLTSQLMTRFSLLLLAGEALGMVASQLL